MIIIADEYGFVSYQDFREYVYKINDAIDDYSPFDDCEDFALVIDGDNLDFQVCPIAEIEINEDTYPLKDLVRKADDGDYLETDLEAIEDVAGKYLFVH